MHDAMDSSPPLSTSPPSASTTQNCPACFQHAPPQFNPDSFGLHLISGNTFLYSGGAVSWMLQQQSTVASSSTHARCIATAGASKGLILLHCLLSELCENVLNPKPLHIDNRASDLLAQNPVNHAAMQCIDVCYCHDPNGPDTTTTQDPPGMHNSI